jgi:hypothetical protein
MNNTYNMPRGQMIKYAKSSLTILNEKYYGSSAGELCISINDLIKFCKNIQKLIPDIYEKPTNMLGKNEKITHSGSLPNCQSMLTFIKDKSVEVYVSYLANGIICE